MSRQDIRFPAGGLGKLRHLAVALLLLAACSPAGSHPPTPASSLPPVETLAARYNPEPAKHQGGAVTVGVWQFPSSLSPVFAGQAAAIPLEQALFDGLTAVDSSLAWYGDLAREVPSLENGEVKPAGGGMEVHFHLRPGLKWSDGQPLTADDVIFTWQAIVGPANTTGASREGYDLITAIEPEAGGGIVMRYKALYPAFLNLFGAILPKHRLAAIDPAKLASDPFWANPDVVSGPFTLKQVANDRIVLVRNPIYAAGRTAAAHLDSLEFQAFPSKQAVLAAVKAGDVQVGIGLDERDLDTVAELRGLRAHLLPALQYEQVSFNQANPNPGTGKPPVWVGDSQVMQAIDLALDRPALAAGPLRGRSPLVATPISPQLGWAHDAALRPAPRDLNLARSLLDADGWRPGPDGIRSKDGRRLTFLLSTAAGQPLRAEEEDLLVAGWKQAGIEARVRNFPPDQFFGAAAAPGVLATGGYEAAIWAWISPPDPDASLNTLSSARIPPAGSDYSRCRDSGIDQALAEGRATLDPGRRSAAYHRFEQAYLKARCELPLYQRLNISVASPRLHNYWPNPAAVGNTWNLADWWVSS